MDLRLFRRRNAPVEDRALSLATSSPVMLTSTTSGQPITPSNALAVADAYACVRALSDAAASVPLIPYRKKSDGRTRTEGRLADLLRQPAPATTQANLIGQMVAHLNLYGNAYLGKFRDADGKVEQLALLHPDRVTPELRAGKPVYTVNDGRGQQSEHGVEDVVHIRALSTDGLIGLSPVRQCRIALGLSQQLASHATTFFENDARPGGLLRVNGAPNGSHQDMVDAIAERWTPNHLGVANAHRIAVVSGDIEFLPVSMPLEDAQFLGQRQLSAVEVARVFRVPPWIIGANSGDSMTYSNTEQQSLHFVTYSLRPHLVLIEQAISEDADLCPGNLYCEFLLDALLRADSKTRAEVYTLALDADHGWMTRDEVRKLENLGPAPPAPPPTAADASTVDTKPTPAPAQPTPPEMTQ